MLKTNTKQVMNAVKQHVLDFYPEIEVLKADLNTRPGFTTYHKAIELVRGGAFLCYYSQVVDFLKEALQETEQEAEKYTDEQSWELYCHLIGKACEKLVALEQ